MGDSKWRYDLDLLIEENIRELIRETKEYDDAILRSRNKGKAQIWVALAILNHKINKLDIEKKSYETKIPKDELSKILKTLESL